jgi:hypothetical protein
LERRVKKVIVLLTLSALAAACHRSSAPSVGASAGNQVGAPSATTALSSFIGAAKAQDLQAVSAVWGGVDGPARDHYPRDEVEKRILTMNCFLKHDRYQVLSEAPGTNGSRVFAVQLTFRDVTRASKFTAVPGPGGRWFLQEFDPEPLQPICQKR